MQAKQNRRKIKTFCSTQPKKKTRPRLDGPIASGWYWRLCMQKLILLVFSYAKLSWQSFHVWRFRDNIAPSPWYYSTPKETKERKKKKNHLHLVISHLINNLVYQAFEQFWVVRSRFNLALFTIVWTRVRGINWLVTCVVCIFVTVKAEMVSFRFNWKADEKREKREEEEVDIKSSRLGTPRYLACYVEEMMDHCSPEFACKPV